VLERTFGCAACGSELLSPFTLDLRLELFAILNSKPTRSIAILDDDLIYHNSIKHLLQNHEGIKADFYDDGKAFLHDLHKNFKNEDHLPAIIFLDIYMPLMTGWEFLDEFEKFNLNLTIPIHVYMVSNSIEPIDDEIWRRYPFVKSRITKPLTQQLLAQILK
jgi:CheY-like chemotaxis protein